MNDDLISRSALLREARLLVDYNEEDGSALCGRINAVEVAAILAAPTMDAEIVRHGRWTKDEDDVFWGNHFIHKRCSECRKEPPMSRFGTGYVLSKYCPGCGAKMDRSEKSEDT